MTDAVCPACVHAVSAIRLWTTVLVCNTNLIAVNPVSSDRSKHIRVQQLRVRDAVELDEIAVDWIATKFMFADGMTKVLPGPALFDMRDSGRSGPPPREPCEGVS